MPSKSDRKKQVERGTKSGDHHHSSRDSGVGSSSASDRASLGTSPDNHFNYVQEQRCNPAAVREALDTANEVIRELETKVNNLNAKLAESNRDNRSLKRENNELNKKVEHLLDDLEDEKRLNGRFRGESPRSDTSRTSDPRPSRKDKRDSWKELPVPKYERPAPPKAPQPPPNNASNPFTPLNERGPSYSTSPVYPTSSHAPSSYTSSSYTPQPSVPYTPSQVMYSPRPTFHSRKQPPNDGGYHRYPVNG